MPKITLEITRVNEIMPQKEATKKLGVHFQTLAKYEINSSNIPFSLLENAGELYSIPLSFTISKGYRITFKNSTILRSNRKAKDPTKATIL